MTKERMSRHHPSRPLVCRFRTLMFGLAWLGLLVTFVAGGCGGDGLPRGAIHGTVTLGGQPLSRGRILFLPVAPSVGPVVSARIQDGKYQLSAADGPLVGTNRVEVDAERDLGFAVDDEQAFALSGGAPLPVNPVPPQFNVHSKLSTIVRDGENIYNVAIPAAQHP